MSNAITPDELKKVQVIQQRILAGENPTPEELNEAIGIVQRWRSAPAAKTTKAASTPMTLDGVNALFDNLKKKDPL